MGQLVLLSQLVLVSLSLIVVPSATKPVPLNGDSHNHHHTEHDNSDNQGHEQEVDHRGEFGSNFEPQVQLHDVEDLTSRIVNHYGNSAQGQTQVGQTQSLLSNHQDTATTEQIYSPPVVGQQNTVIQQSTTRNVITSQPHRQHQYSDNPFFSDDSADLLHVPQSFKPPQNPVFQLEQQQSQIPPEDLNTHPLGGPAGPLGPINDQCPGPQWALPCVSRDECDPFTGFVKSDGVTLPTPPNKDTPTVALGRCKLPHGNVGVCCKRLPFVKTTVAPSTSAQNNGLKSNINIFLPEYTDHKQPQGGSSNQHGVQDKTQYASNVNSFLPEYTDHKQQQGGSSNQHGVQDQTQHASNVNIFLPEYTAYKQQQRGGNDEKSQVQGTAGLFVPEQQQYNPEHLQQQHNEEHFVNEQADNVLVPQQVHQQQKEGSQLEKEVSIADIFSERDQHTEYQEQQYVTEDGYEQEPGKIQPR